MAYENYRRKLTTIHSADVVRYSRLMGDDESATISTLKSRCNLVNFKAQIFNGRVVDSSGNIFLSEFSSFIESVSCEAELQRRLNEKNDGIPDNRK